VVFYGLGAVEPATLLPATQRELHTQLKAWGLPGIAQSWTATGRGGLVAALDALGVARASFAFPTDGAVIKLDSGPLQRELGSSEHAPRWAIAFKFAPERAATRLLAITAQVGRTGVITPVAELAPVVLSGSTITRATLDNGDEIARKDIRVGDTVYVEKAGEIIPAIVGVDLARRPAGAPAYAFPANCPGCGGAITARSGETAVRCLNGSCPAQLRRRLEHFASKACVDIGGLGPALIDALVEKRLVGSIADLYRLRTQDLAAAGRTAGKSAAQVLARIEASKTAELWRFIYGLGIPQIGAVTARELARRCGSLDALAELRERPAATHRAEAARNDPALRAVATHFTDPRHRAVIDQLLSAGVRPSAPGTGTALAGKTFVLTGTLPTLSRAQATRLIESAGGKVSNSVSRGTNFLVAGADPGAKLTQAKALGIATIDETELLRMVREP
jgi:DNA ligase (NAD+)